MHYQLNIKFVCILENTDTTQDIIIVSYTLISLSFSAQAASRISPTSGSIWAHGLYVKGAEEYYGYF